MTSMKKIVIFKKMTKLLKKKMGNKKMTVMKN